MPRVPEEALHYNAAEDTYALDGQPFTGVAYRTYPGGAPMSETTYRDGVFSGLSRGWWPSGALEVETHYSSSGDHSRSRCWHENGQLAEEDAHEHGTLLYRKRWDASGTLIEAYTLQESDAAHRALQLARQVFGTPDPDDPSSEPR